jgi:hypothetical protein
LARELAKQLGEYKMKKMHVLALATLSIIVLLIAVTLPVQAGPPQNASGLWQYQPFIMEAREAGCNTFLTTFENGLWTGTFEGTSTEDGKVVIHCNGSWSFNAIVTFEGKVDGREGTLEMSVNGSRPDETADWFGRWVITDGTDGLKNLRGQGTWWGPGAPAPEEWGDIYYGGNYHFEPN